MTADIKRRSQLCEVFMMVFALWALEETEPVHPTVDPAAIRGLGPT
jgi:hypothetical protein